MSEILDHLEELEDRGLYRRMRMVSGPQGPRVLLDGKRVLLLCSNNYLGLADHPRVREAAARAAMRYGVGAGASRLISGNMTLHHRLEERLAEFKRTESCVLFGSGYLANTGVVAALARRGDVVFSDELNHASIVDGCRLAQADTFVYDHLDVEHLEWGLNEAGGRGSLIVTDGVFSMDGDVAPLVDIVDLARRYDARVLVDEAHATGVLGPAGRGSVAAAGLSGEVDVVVGTLGKALGSYGAYVCCSEDMGRYLVNTARTLIFSTAPAPPSVAAALTALELLQEQPRRVERLQRNARVLREALAAEGLRPRPATPRSCRCASATRSRHGGLRAGARAGGVRAGHPAPDRAGRHVAAAPGRDGVPHQDRAPIGRDGRGGGDAAGERGPAKRPRTRVPAWAKARSATACRRGLTNPRDDACVASSSPAPTPAPASPCWPPRCARRSPPAGSGWPRSSLR